MYPASAIPIHALTYTPNARLRSSRVHCAFSSWVSLLRLERILRPYSTHDDVHESRIVPTFLELPSGPWIPRPRISWRNSAHLRLREPHATQHQRPKLHRSRASGHAAALKNGVVSIEYDTWFTDFLGEINSAVYLHNLPRSLPGPLLQSAAQGMPRYHKNSPAAGRWGRPAQCIAL